MSDKLIKLYTEILQCASMTADNEGFVSFSMVGKKEPVLIEGKRLVLPTLENQRNPQPDQKIIFHPLTENVMRNESETLGKLRSVFNIKLNYAFAALAQNLLTIATSVADHAKLNPAQSEMLSWTKTADEQTVVNFSRMMTNVIKEKYDSAFVNIYLKRSGTVNMTKYARVGVVTFPLYTELCTDQETVYGVKVRTKDREAIKGIHEYIFSKIKEKEGYNVGSNSLVAPFLDSLMRTLMGIGSDINAVVDLFENKINDSDELKFSADWWDDFINMDSLVNEIRKIPPQKGNEGTVTQAPVPMNQVQTTQTQTAPIPAMTPSYVPQHVHPSTQFQQQAPAPALTENGKVDFRSIVAQNPHAFPQQTFGYQNNYMPQQVNAQVLHGSTPRWAQPQMQPMMNQMQNPWQQQPQQMQQSPWGMSNNNGFMRV